MSAKRSGDLPPLERLVGLERAAEQAFGDLPRQETLQLAGPDELRHLLLDARLEAAVQPGHLREVLGLEVVQALPGQARLDARAQHDRVERLHEVVVGAELDAAHRAPDVVERRDHQHRHVPQRLVVPHVLEHP